MVFAEDEPVCSVAEDRGTRDTHPAFGVAVVSRSRGSGRALFQSDLMHTETITLAIQTAERVRDLNRDWVHPRLTVVECEMSLAQWGAVVSSVGIGSGVPVTLRHTQERPHVPSIPYEPRIAESVEEVRASIEKMLARARETLVVLEEAISEKKGVVAVRDALRSHSLTIAGAENNAVFAVESLTRAAEKVTSQARSDIEAHILHASALTGVEAPIQLPAMIAEEKTLPSESAS